MSLFRRGRAKDEQRAPEPVEAPERATVEADVVETDDEGADGGPWDVADAPESDGLIDLGSLRVPGRAGMQVRMELEPRTRRVVAVNVALDGSALQLQAFAAPRSEGLWIELRQEIAESIRKQGGAVETRTGSFGTELLARLPVRTPDGRSGHRPARFIGVDGPRWFLRGVLTGRGAVEPDAAAIMEDLISGVVVVRGTDARAPRDLLPLHLPGQPGEAPQPTAGRPVLDLDGGRGPEIAEVQ